MRRLRFVGGASWRVALLAVSVAGCVAAAVVAVRSGCARFVTGCLARSVAAGVLASLQALAVSVRSLCRAGAVLRCGALLPVVAVGSSGCWLPVPRLCCGRCSVDIGAVGRSGLGSEPGWGTLLCRALRAGDRLGVALGSLFLSEVRCGCFPVSGVAFGADAVCRPPRWWSFLGRVGRSVSPLSCCLVLGSSVAGGLAGRCLWLVDACSGPLCWAGRAGCVLERDALLSGVPLLVPDECVSGVQGLLSAGRAVWLLSGGPAFFIVSKYKNLRRCPPCANTF